MHNAKPKNSGEFKNQIRMARNGSVRMEVSIPNYILTEKTLALPQEGASVKAGLWRYSGGLVERQDLVQIPVPDRFYSPDWGAFASTQGLRQGQGPMPAPRGAVCVWPGGEEPVRVRFHPKETMGVVALADHLSQLTDLTQEQRLLLHLIEALPRLGDEKFEPRGALRHLKVEDRVARPSNFRFFNLPPQMRAGSTVTVRVDYNERPEKSTDSRDRDVIRWMSSSEGPPIEKKRWVLSRWGWQDGRGWGPDFIGWTNLPFLCLPGQIVQVWSGDAAISGEGMPTYIGVLDGKAEFLSVEGLVEEGRKFMAPILTRVKSAMAAEQQRGLEARSEAKGLLSIEL